MVIHPEARTTPQIRAEIKASSHLTQTALAEKYNVSIQTIRKWQTREETTDKSHRPDRLQTTLSTIQEEIVVMLRKTLFLPLDDLGTGLLPFRDTTYSIFFVCYFVFYLQHVVSLNGSSPVPMIY